MGGESILTTRHRNNLQLPTVDIPLFWRDKITELDVNSNIDEEEMVQYRLHSILQMIYSDERYNPYIEKDLDIRVLIEYLKNYKNYTL